jgi:membrane-bound lytic murein transglycosylase B
MEQTIFAAITAFTLAFVPAQTTPQEKPKPPVTEKREIVYVVKQGDSIASIAKNEYGSTDFWINIWNDNSWIKNPNVIEKNWRIKIDKKKNKKVAKLSKELELKVNSRRLITNIPPNTPLRASNKEIKPSSYDNIYQEAGAKYGVPWQILYGLHLTETGLRDGEIYNGQGSGAQGPMQFMPGTWRAYGVDGNGDGVADINNAVDAIHGAANYLQKHGSLAQGLNSYGGNTTGTLNAAASRGYGQ